MIVQQIITKVRLLIDTDLTDTQFVDELNQISKQLFREYPLPDAVYKFTTTSTPYYDLPDDCAEDRIRVVIVNDIEYEKLSPEIQSVDRPFCTVLMEKLFISPNPVGEDAYLYYGPRHVDLSAEDLTAIPSFPEDYHDILVFKLARYAAMIQRDIDLVNNFKGECDDLERKAEKGLKKMGLRRAKETMRW